MKKCKLTPIMGIAAGILAITLSVGVCTAGVISTNKAIQTDASVGTYYDGITATSGTALLGQLHDLTTSAHTTYTTYDNCKDATMVYATDGNPSDSSKTIEFYSQADIASSWGGGAQGTWNREHVWCQSLSNSLWGETGGGADLQHIRPVECGLNSARNNSPYGIVASHISDNEKYYEDSLNVNVALAGWKANDIFEPLDSVKGDVARIVLYMYTHYNTYSNSCFGGNATTNGSGSTSYFGTLDINNIVSATDGTDASAFALLLEWNTNDPVSSAETRRNEAAFGYQGNRNPFIDHPEYVNAIWGEGVMLTMPSTASVVIGSTTSVAATLTGGTGTISYSSGSAGVATINSSTGVVTGVSIGEAVITASATISGTTYTANCTVTVTAAPTYVTSITVAGDESLAAGSTTTYTVTITPSDATNKNVTWSSGTTSVATINSSTGVITGVSAGESLITATAADGSGVTGTKTITITASLSGSYELVTDASTLAVGDTVVFACNTKGAVAGAIASGSSTTYMSSITSTFATDYSTITALGTGSVEMTLGGTSGAWTFTSSSGLLGATDLTKIAWAEGTTTWSISITSSSPYAATIQNGTSTYGRFLYNHTYTRFTTYTTDPTTSRILPQLYRKAEVTAAEYAATFLSSSGVVCDATGATAPSTSQWSAQASAYAALSSSVQAELTNATANVSGTDVEKCVARYDYILSKYSTTNYANFMNRTVSSLALQRDADGVLSQDNATLIIVLVAVVGLTAIGGFFFFMKKRKEQ